MLSKESLKAKELFQSQLGLVKEVVRYACSRYALGRDESADVFSFVCLRLIENDYRVLRKFRGDSTLRTYLTTVVCRLLLDHRIQKWGKWRPSAQAKRLGPVAIQLDTLLHREGYSRDEAVEMLRSNGRVETTRSELTKMAEELPRRTRRTFVGQAVLGLLAADGRVEERLLASERMQVASEIEFILRRALKALSREDCLILKMRFDGDLQICQIARILNLEPRPLYRRIERCLKQLRRAVEAAGLKRARVADLLGSNNLEMRIVGFTAGSWKDLVAAA